MSTVSPAVVLLKTAAWSSEGAELDGHFRVRAPDTAQYEVRLRERWTATSEPARYAYEVRRLQGPEVIAFHLHPNLTGSLIHHLHLGAGAGSLMPELTTAHVPTGPVTAVAFLRFVIEDLGVRTLREDWRGVLESAERP